MTLTNNQSRCFLIIDFLRMTHRLFDLSVGFQPGHGAAVNFFDFFRRAGFLHIALKHLLKNMVETKPVVLEVQRNAERSPRIMGYAFPMFMIHAGSIVAAFVIAQRLTERGAKPIQYGNSGDAFPAHRREF